MITPSDILSQLPLQTIETYVLVEDNDTHDIIKGIILMSNQEIEVYKIIANYLISNIDTDKIPEFLFDFCKKYVKYVVVTSTGRMERDSWNENI